MAKYSEVDVRIPDLKGTYSYRVGSRTIYYTDAAVKTANINTIKKIWSKYGASIKRWGDIYEIPYGIIVGFIATESSGENLEPNPSRATGLMQVTPPAVYDTFRKFKFFTKTDLPAEAKASMNSKIPEILGSNTISRNIDAKILRFLQIDPDFNIMCGCTYLRVALEKFSFTNVALKKKSALNKVLVGYNAGVNLSILKVQPNAASDTTFLATSSRVPSESRDYLYKMLGKDGFFSLIYIDLANQGYKI